MSGVGWVCQRMMCLSDLDSQLISKDAVGVKKVSPSGIQTKVVVLRVSERRCVSDLDIS